LRIQINGEPREIGEHTSLPELVATLKLKAEQVAIELNQKVVRRAQWGSTVLHADDKVEIVHFVGGGCESVGRSSRQEAAAGI
jgi:thiamine biosynthesis protein ThiS